MMKHVRLGIFVAVLILIVAPVIFVQLGGSDRRSFRATKLEDTNYTEITFRNTNQRLDLGGMLFAPAGDGPFPAVVIIHGSGTSRRQNGWYLTLTEYLQENGIVVLLPDKRGSEKSDGNWRNASFDDLATDTLAGVQFLKEQNLVAVSRIGLVGMSQGGWIAPIAANKSSEVAFLVSVVSSAVTPKDQLIYEEDHNLRQIGLLPGISRLVAYLSTSYIRNIAQRDFWSANGNFDPLPLWRQLDINALCLYGEDDTNVPSAKSAENLRSLNNPYIKIEIFEGSGHALEDPEGRGDSIFRIDALRDIASFIHAQSNRP
jgi:dienelactone hydrolase